MIAASLLTMHLFIGQADSHNGSLEIDTSEQEATENKNKDLDRYDTTLFNDDSQSVNNMLKEKQMNKMQDVKKDMFQEEAGESSRLSETKKQLFGPVSDKQKVRYDKVPYTQEAQKKSIFTYLMMAGGLILMISFIAYTIIRRRKRENHEIS
ncbi:type VII secretion protein EssA [Staphylococcus sp. IVB6181]|uniref:type VII secretion protein EssA n=1 Tax=Staphylococcus sp. IVB6181 TaxID=2929481 RepID=UPI0021CF084B|nr:type VII secretion protein EssA [Staphylococcus sp. IVB6181]UXV34860.1 type VII secretion protein EssA [Staphylococcus sp. IVB6181]